jgi:HSP20 family protein
VDLYETAHDYVLTAELPGLAREQIDIHAEDSRIVIRGARAAGPDRDIPCEQFHRVERGHGRFSRAFSLPEPIDVDGVTADLKDGVLTVTIPKSAGRGTRRIDVS